MTSIQKRYVNALAAIMLIFSCFMPSTSAFADTSEGDTSSGDSDSETTNTQTEVEESAGEVIIDKSGEQAYIEGCNFAVTDFSRAQKGSNRDVNGVYEGYTYYLGSTPEYAIAIVTEEYVVCYVPQSAEEFCSISDEDALGQLQSYFHALDTVALNAGVIMSLDIPWYYTSETEYTVGDIVYKFGEELAEGKYYAIVVGTEGQDVVTEDGYTTGRPTHVDFLQIAAPDEVDIELAPTGFAALAEFLSGIDYSPLWVTLKTTLTAIVFIFVLGLAAAYLTLRVSKRAQDIFDTIFTIPMVLPPTVCGFILLLCLGRNSPVGQWFIDIGFPLIFSWPATVIAATVVAFPLMYRSSRGAFENLDPNMLDAARTLGWSNLKIFFKLMIPLSWSSIAAATVLAYARALGEFGATLFLAGNYAGVTRTISIAIYFEWMSGNTDVAIFWTIVILIFSFLVILFINLWSRHTTKYRRGASE